MQLMQQMLYSNKKHGNKEGSIDMKWINKSQPALICSKSTVETSEQCVKFAQGSQKRHQNDINNIVLVSLLLTLIDFIPDVFIIDFEQVNAGWDGVSFHTCISLNLHHSNLCVQALMVLFGLVGH